MPKNVCGKCGGYDSSSNHVSWSPLFGYLCAQCLKIETDKELYEGE